MDSSLSTLPKVPITADRSDADDLNKTEEAVSDVYARLKKTGGGTKADSITELQVPAIEAIKDSDTSSNDDLKGTDAAVGNAALNDTLEVVETPAAKEKKIAAIDPWEVPPQAQSNTQETKLPTEKKSLDQILDESSKAATAVPTATETPLPKATATAIATITPKVAPIPKATLVPKEKKDEKVAITQGVAKKGWYAQVAAPQSKAESDTISTKLRNNGFMVAIDTAKVNGVEYFRILVGPEENRAQAEQLVEQLKRESYISGTPFLKMIH